MKYSSRRSVSKKNMTKPSRSAATGQHGSNLFGMSFPDTAGQGNSLNLFALLALFLSGLVILALGIYYLVIYRRAKGEVPKKVQTLGIINVVVGAVAILFSAVAFFFM